MKKIFLVLVSVGVALFAGSQANVLPATAQKAPVVIKNATIHTGDGTVSDNGTIVSENGKVTWVGKD